MLIDTSVAIDILRDHPPAVAFLSVLPNVPRLAAPTITELYAGVKGLREQQALDRFVAAAAVLGCDLAVARLAGDYLRRFRPSHGIDLADATIAATAAHHGLPLATLNLKHFPMFEGLERPY